MEIDGWSSLSGPDVYSEFRGVQCPYAIKDSSGMITGYDTWENDYYSRTRIWIIDVDFYIIKTVEFLFAKVYKIISISMTLKFFINVKIISKEQ